MSIITQRLRALSNDRLARIGRGIEKESLRADQTGALALTPHPSALGSALTHPHITTDFCESQIELVTGVHDSVDGCLAELQQIHQFVLRQMGDEMLWAGSMPCQLPTDETIPIARYGTSNVGRAKSVYRMGLGHRYGRRMQTISGIHYNWSMPGLDNDDYFALIRNFRRHSFLLLLLFGASPAVCSSFVAGREHVLQPMGEYSQGLPFATSLRMGRLGYQSDAQSTLAVSYNSLESYAASLHEALERPHPPYEALGIQNTGGEYNQLATTLLQIENEFYGTIRPKRVIRSGERPLHALRDRGVEYVEVRCMDLDPFEPLGINATTVRFLDVFLLHCMLADSAPDSPEEIKALARNQEKVASRGREPGLRLERANGHLTEVPLTQWAGELLQDLAPIAAALDAATGGSHDHRDALALALRNLADFDQLPSARALTAMNQGARPSHVDFVRQCSLRTREVLQQWPWPETSERLMREQANLSINEQAALEAAPAVPFEAYRRQYVSPQRLVPLSV